MTFRKTGWALFACAFLAAFALESGELNSSDAGMRLQVTRWLWTDEPQVRDADGWFGIYGRDGEKFAWYGLGQSLWMSPSYLIASQLAPMVTDDRRLAEKVEEMLVTYLTFPLTSALIVTVLYALLCRLGFSVPVAGLSAFGAFWCTSLLPYTNINQENSLLLLCAVSALWAVAAGVACGRFGWWALAGLAAGLGLLTRLTFVFDLGAVALFGLGLIIFTRPEQWSIRLRYWLPRICLAGVVCAVFFAIDRIYHFYRFDSWTSTYYDVIFAQRSDVVAPGDFRIGFPALAWSVKNNIWQFDPVALMGILTVPFAWRWLSAAQRIFAAAAVMLMAVYLAFYSSTHNQFDGAGAWGCRYVTTPVVLLGAFALAAIIAGGGRCPVWLRRTGVVLVVLGFVIQIASTVFWYNLEERQQVERLGASSSMVVLRFQNTAALVADRWAEWGLLPPGESARLRTPNYFPFLVSKYLGPSAKTVLYVLWAAALLAALAANVILLRRLVRMNGIGRQGAGQEKDEQ
jgi:hypothetical protein